MSTWKTIKQAGHQEIINTRKNLHAAVQIVGAVPRNILPKDPTDTTASLLWNSDLKGLTSNSFSCEDGKASIALSFKDFKFMLIKDGIIKSAFPLRNKSVDQGLHWVKGELNSIGCEGDNVDLNLPYEIEKYDYSQKLKVNDSALTILANLYENVYHVLKEVVTKWHRTEEIRCWPHHFDLATLIALEKNNDGETTKSIGVGLSPGDEGVQEPYIYVNIWPGIDYEELSKHQLIAGDWNEDGWSGAVLKYSEMISGNQEEVTTDFVHKTIKLLFHLGG